MSDDAATFAPPSPVRVGILGSSWWVDSMYLPALASHPQGQVVAIAGRDAETLAQRWSIPHAFGRYQDLLDSGLVDALIIATRNDLHADLTYAGLDRGLHILCEKPLALDYPETVGMARRAAEAGAICMTPFTYAWMPIPRYIKRLIDQDYLGTPHHLNLRYFTGFGADVAGEDSYNWRFDQSVAGSGALGDIACHFLYLAQWFFGDIVAVFAELGRLIQRAPLNPQGQPYPQADDNALLLFKFANGAQGVLHASTVANEETPFGQRHEMDLHGSHGTLHARIDWDRDQFLRGARRGEGPPQILAIPDEIWDGARHDTVHNTYRDVFRTQESMARQWVSAIADGQPVRPNFADGAAIQRVMDAARRSHDQGRWVDIEEISEEISEEITGQTTGEIQP
jgi:predicted dehydrogenase